MTIGEAISEGAEALRLRRGDDARRTAGLLLGHVLGLDRAQMIARSKDQVSESDLEKYRALIGRSAEGEPLQHLTGHQEFYGLDLIVTRDVLIPRPETEFLVERTLALAKSAGQETLLIVDLGTGSGCIAIALAKMLTGARLIAIDVSEAALNVARPNAERHDVADHIEFLRSDFLDALSQRGSEGQIDFIVSNPPYVPADDPEMVQAEVRDWEPSIALFGGEDGLDFYRRLLRESPPFLKRGGCLIFEIGFRQLEAIKKMIDESEWILCEVTEDLQGIPRVVSLRRRGA
ncbi:MAG TPA: peptide chain release factor N(5)-glutamine methyltransferase [Blastocatellia bacterium]|jgi:release factor glutamine methyltransferase|nr:peptide chain release factor N(5)-glutamine methyltransferase [Blastocatellia bacterium]